MTGRKVARSDVSATIAKRIAELRAAHKLSLQDLADRAGCTKAHIWELEQGRSSNPSISLGISIAAALGVSLDYLAGLSDAVPALHPEALRIACEVDALLRGRMAETN